MQITLPRWAYVTLFVASLLAAYFIGVVPAEGSFDDLTTNQWLGALVALSIGLGVGGATRPADPTVVARTSGDGVVAGEAARYETGSPLAKSTTLSTLVDPHATRVNRGEQIGRVDEPPA